MPSTYTAVAGNVSLASGVTETLPADGESANVASVNGALSKLADYIEALRQRSISTTPVAITPNSGWTAGDGLAYWKDASGIVHIKGSVTFATGGAADAFSLPAGFRPAFPREFSVVAGPSVFSLTEGFVRVDGTVTLNVAPTNAAKYYLDSFIFLAEA